MPLRKLSPSEDLNITLEAGIPWRQRESKTTPKAHWLLHCVIFAKEQRWLGLLSYQCLESLHSKLNLLMNRFIHTGDQMTALEGMLKHQLLWNFIHDEGLDEGQLLEEDQEEKENFSP
uniref:Uncharacterized protein n=1 Tax=Meloidogyne enterolobii TaxID=390850 RepID=A0A6V7XFN6_MELEN|nr:unnamed protein product [Meloidogyne enterolobii]